MYKIYSKEHMLTKDIMNQCLKSDNSKKLSWYKAGKTISVNDRMQTDYSYKLTYDAGKAIRKGGVDTSGKLIRYPKFKPRYTPGQMLKLGVFSGKYCNDQIFEFPKEWFKLDKLSPEKANPKLNYFGVKSRQSLKIWLANGWIPCHKDDKDVRGWFEWWCRYWLGRRIPSVDCVQIKRWLSFNRHYAQFLKRSVGTPIHIHAKRKQGLLQWSYPCMS
jgi:hypothetical protein